MSRRWCFTLNNWTVTEYEQIIDKINNTMADIVRYAVIGKETGETGTPHLQGYLSLTKVMRLKAIKVLLGDRAHAEPAKGTEEQNHDYCSKEKNFVEFGTRSKQGKRTDLDEIAEMVDNGASLLSVAEFKPATYIRNYRGIQNYMQLKVKDYNHDVTRGLWIWGPPGFGKSHHARLINPNSTYLKPQSKWFDGYAGEEVILLDDLDTGILGHYLKIWADKYACSGEVKGGTVKLQHKLFIVTSNYPIGFFFPDDPEMKKAVERRFKQIHLTGLVEHLDMINPQP